MDVEPVEIAHGAWVFHSASAHRNSGVLLTGGGAVLVDPEAIPGGLEGILRFVQEAGHEVRGVALTHAGEASPGASPRFGSAALVSPESYRDRSAIAFMPGWEAIPLGNEEINRLGLYSMRIRTLFCGEMLSDATIPSLQGGSSSYLGSLDSIEALGAGFIVPTSGTAAQGQEAVQQRLQKDRSYVYALRQHTIASLTAGATEERVLEVAREIYESYPFLEEHLRNVRHVWKELSTAGPGASPRSA